METRSFDWQRAGAPGSEALGESDEKGRMRQLYVHRQDEHPFTPTAIERLRERIQGDAALAQGQSNITTLAPGRIFKLQGHMRSDLDQRWIARRVRHIADCPEREIETPAKVGPPYLNHFECSLEDVPLRPAQLTPKPRVFGPQTAIVTGPAGKEIHTDEFGRVKVLFHWDRLNPPDETSSCWLRVAQRWAGPGYGSWFLPRIGMEVLVEFIDGDPDRPIVVGCLYNSEAPQSLGFPTDETKSGLRTKSSPGSEGYNELIFEDAAGNEEISLHAQRNLREKVEADHSTNVGSNQSNTVGAAQTINVGGTRSIEVGKDDDETFKANRSTKVIKDDSLTVTGNLKVSTSLLTTIAAIGGMGLTVNGNMGVTVQAEGGGDLEYKTVVKGKQLTEVDSEYDLVATKKLRLAQDSKVSLTFDEGKATLDVADSLTITVGPATITVKNDGSVAIDAIKEIALTSGPSSIVMSPTAIELTCAASSIKLDPAGVTTEGPMVRSNGLAMHEITGGIVKLN